MTSIKLLTNFKKRYSKFTHFHL